ncbi:MAG: hypothetical protein N2316_07570 [Spirochaetes bacterium]|nr:hypothetical protein [Spirochaetota bacterium]
MKKICIATLLVGAGIFCLAISANAQTTYGSAFKSPFTIMWGAIELDHTYFCLNGTSDCYAIASSGIQSSSTGGTRMWDTYGPTTPSERCASRARASNNISSPCFIIYGVTGVCHTQTNRGLASFGKRLNHNNLKGGWASLTAYGYYGAGWDNCRRTSNIGCGRNPDDR